MRSPEHRTTFASLPARSSDETTALNASYGYDNDEDPLAPRMLKFEPDIAEPVVNTSVADNSKSDPTEPAVIPTKNGTKAADIKYINDTVERFLKSLQEPKYANPLTGDEISELFQAFYKQIDEELDTPGKMLSKEEQQVKKKTITKTLDAVERSLCSALYPKLLEPNNGTDSAKALRFEQRLTALRESERLLDKLELDISPQLRPSLEPVIGYLSSNIDKAKSPQDKIHVIVQVNKMIVEVFKDTNVSGDAILPVIVYCVLASPGSNIWRQVMYVRRFRRASAIKGQYNYCLTNMEAAVQYLDSVPIPADDLPPNVDPAIFEARSRSGSAASRSRSSSDARTTPIRTRIGTLGTSMGAVSKYLFSKVQQPATIADVRRNFDSDSTSVSTGDAESYVVPAVNPRFMSIEADQLAIGDVKTLLAEYKRLASYLQGSYL